MTINSLNNDISRVLDSIEETFNDYEGLNIDMREFSVDEQKRCTELMIILDGEETLDINACHQKVSSINSGEADQRAGDLNQLLSEYEDRMGEYEAALAELKGFGDN